MAAAITVAFRAIPCKPWGCNDVVQVSNRRVCFSGSQSFRLCVCRVRRDEESRRDIPRPRGHPGFRPGVVRNCSSFTFPVRGHCWGLCGFLRNSCGDRDRLPSIRGVGKRHLRTALTAETKAAPPGSF